MLSGQCFGCHANKTSNFCLGHDWAFRIFMGPAAAISSSSCDCPLKCSFQHVIIGTQPAPKMCETYSALLPHWASMLFVACMGVDASFASQNMWVRKSASGSLHLKTKPTLTIILTSRRREPLSGEVNSACHIGCQTTEAHPNALRRSRNLNAVTFRTEKAGHQRLRELVALDSGGHACKS